MTKQQIIILVILPLMTACATAAQRQCQTIVQSNTAAAADAKACTQAVYQSPDFAPLRAHVPPDIRAATLDQMTDTATVIPEEITALKATHAQISECRTRYIQTLITTTPSLAVIFTDDFTKADTTLIELIQEKFHGENTLMLVKHGMPNCKKRL